MTTPFISSLIGAALCLSALLLGAYVTLQARRRRARPTQSRANDYDAVPVPTRRAGEGPLFAHPPTHPDAAPQVASSTPAPAALPYTRKHSLLTQAERDFFAVLQEAAPPGWHIFPQVRLNGLLVIRAPERSRMWWAHFNWVSAKSVDFVLCDGADISPQLVVELDDSSHRRPDRQERDAFVDAALASAGLPILHVPWQRRYDAAKLAAAIQRAVGLPAATPQLGSAPATVASMPMRESPATPLSPALLAQASVAPPPRMACMHSGAEVSMTAKFCASCGTVLEF